MSKEGKYSPNDKDEERGETGEEENRGSGERDEIWRNRGKERNIDYQDVCTCLACANMLAILQF